MTDDSISRSGVRPDEPTFSPDEITPEHWGWVRGLLADVDRQNHCENLLSAWGQWQLVARQFRQAEFGLMRRREPQPIDLQWHEMLATGLLSLGQRLLKQIAHTSDPEEFSRLGFRLDAAEAQLRTLRQNWEEWHGTVDEDRLSHLREKLLPPNAQESPR